MDQILPQHSTHRSIFSQLSCDFAPVVSRYWFKAWVPLRNKGYHSTQHLEEAVSTHKTSSVVTFVIGKWGQEGQQCDITCWRRMEKRHLQSKVPSSFFLIRAVWNLWTTLTLDHFSLLYSNNQYLTGRVGRMFEHTVVASTRILSPNTPDPKAKWMMGLIMMTMHVQENM